MYTTIKRKIIKINRKHNFDNAIGDISNNNFKILKKPHEKILAKKKHFKTGEKKI